MGCGDFRISPRRATGRQRKCLGDSLKNGSALEWACDELKRDRVIVMEAMVNCGSALTYSSDDLKEAVTRDGNLFNYLSKKFGPIKTSSWLQCQIKDVH